MKSRIVLALCGALGLACTAHADVGALTVEDAHAKVLRGELVLIDVRTPGEWESTGMPQDSRGITLGDKAFLGEARGAVQGDLEFPVALICRSGKRSTTAAGQLRKAGFGQVFNVTAGVEGTDGWLANDLPTDTFIEN